MNYHLLGKLYVKKNNSNIFIISHKQQ